MNRLFVACPICEYDGIVSPTETQRGTVFCLTNGNHNAGLLSSWDWDKDRPITILSWFSKGESRSTYGPASIDIIRDVNNWILANRSDYSYPEAV